VFHDLDVLFEWDPAKARNNLEKHRVSFDEAATVFYDDSAIIDDDPDHSLGEHRELILGLSAGRRLVLVSFTERGDRIRIIHARNATPHERQRYEENIDY
jgi:hypothetical protein